MKLLTFPSFRKRIVFSGFVFPAFKGSGNCLNQNNKACNYANIILFKEMKKIKTPAFEIWRVQRRCLSLVEVLPLKKEADRYIKEKENRDLDYQYVLTRNSFWVRPNGDLEVSRSNMDMPKAIIKDRYYDFLWRFLPREELTNELLQKMVDHFIKAPKVLTGTSEFRITDDIYLLLCPTLTIALFNKGEQVWMTRLLEHVDSLSGISSYLKELASQLAYEIRKTNGKLTQAELEVEDLFNNQHNLN